MPNSLNNSIVTDESYNIYSTNDSSGLIDYFKDTTKWATFVNGITGATATGTPTIELFIESYNKKHNTSLKYTDGLTVDNTDTLYFPYTNWVFSN